MKKNSLVSLVKYFILIVLRESRVVSVVSGEKQLSEGNQMFDFNSSERKTAG